MPEQKALDPLTVQDELPRQQAGHDYREDGQRGNRQIQISGACQLRSALTTREQIEAYPADKQRYWKMNQNNVLRMLGQHDCSDVKWVHHIRNLPPLLNHDLTDHLGMDRAVVGIHAGLAECVREFLVGIESFRLEHAVVARDHVWNIVLIHPGDGT